MNRLLIALALTVATGGAALAQSAQTPATAAPLAAPAPLTPAQQMQLELERYRAAYEQEAAKARDLTAERDRLKAQADKATATLASCEEKNDRLQALTAEVLDAYGSIKVLDVIGRMEPFLGLKRVELENIVQGYGDRAYGLRCDARVAAAPEPAPAPETATTPPAGS